jgi:hypothetical protein
LIAGDFMMLVYASLLLAISGQSAKGKSRALRTYHFIDEPRVAGIKFHSMKALPDKNPVFQLILLSYRYLILL